MQNSQYKPSSRAGYSSLDLNLDFKGQKFDLSANTANNCDFLVSDDYILDGIIIDTLNHSLGDKISLQVIDKDNVMGYGSNVILKQFATDIYMTPGLTRQVDHQSVYPAKVFAGLYVRIIYTSVHESTAPTILVRYNLHKVLW